MKKEGKYLNLAREIVERENDNYINFNKCSCYSPEMIGTRIEGFENSGTGGDHPNCCIVLVGQNTEKTPRDLGRLAVPVKNNQGVK